MPTRIVPSSLVTDSPLKVAPGLLRAVLAAVFNRDITEDGMLTEAEASAALSAKMLSDLGFESMEALDILRHFKDIMEEWGERLREATASHGGNKAIKLRPGAMVLTISDNRRAAMLYGDAKKTKFYDFKKAKELTALTGSAPILQLALNLSQLFESVVDTRQSPWYSHAAKEAVGSGS